MATYATTPLLLFTLVLLIFEGNVLAENEIQSTLYLIQVTQGPDRNQATAVGTGGFSTITVSDWAVVIEPRKDAKVIGRAQGLHIIASQTKRSYYTSMNLIFEDVTRLNGSTLQVMGSLPDDGQWSIIGGTGKLTKATGIVTHKIVQQGQDLSIFEINIHAYSTPMDSMAVSANSQGPEIYGDF